MILVQQDGDTGKAVVSGDYIHSAVAVYIR